MLIKEVAAEFGNRVKVVTEEYGNSETAQRFGVRRYPVVFVDDVLVARPKDFGFKGAEDVGTGRYVPWREPQNQARFRDDLRRWVRKRLQGQQVEGYSAARAVHGVATRENVDMPIARGIYRILYENEPAKDVVKELMTRPIRAEVE